MITRTANIGDIESIQSLFWELDTDAVSFQPEHFVRAARPDEYLISIIEGDRSDFILAITQDRVIGFSLILEREMGGISCLKPCRYAYVQDFVIAGECRNRGYGTALFQAAKAWAMERHLGYLRLSVFPQNTDGIRFYERQGLRENMVTMECPLSAE